MIAVTAWAGRQADVLDRAELAVEHVEVLDRESAPASAAASRAGAAGLHGRRCGAVAVDGRAVAAVRAAAALVARRPRLDRHAACLCHRILVGRGHGAGPDKDIDGEDEQQEQEGRAPGLLVQHLDRLSGVGVDEERQRVHRLREVADVDQATAKRGEEERRGLAACARKGEHDPGQDPGRPVRRTTERTVRQSGTPSASEASRSASGTSAGSPRSSA